MIATERTTTWTQLAEYARWAPSPHNTQPTRLRIVDDTRAQLLFVPGRGLPVGDPQGRFTFLTFGIFVEILRIAAHARGCEVEATFLDRPLYGGTDGGVEPRSVADLRLVPCRDAIDDLEPALVLRRRTNRLPYDGRPVPPRVVAELQDEARRFGHTFEVSTEQHVIEWVKELNRDVLYHDLEHDRYREELASWLRYSAADGRRLRDGLTAQALALPGWLLKAFMRHHRILTAPGIKQLTQRAYLRTMTGIPTVAWIRGDFVDAADWVRAGELMTRLWLILTRHGIDWQPYGSVITNEEARARLVTRLGTPERDGEMVWLLVRMGYAAQDPVRSERLELSEVLR